MQLTLSQTSDSQVCTSQLQTIVPLAQGLKLSMVWQDEIGLSGGLTFGQITIAASGRNTLIKLGSGYAGSPQELLSFSHVCDSSEPFSSQLFS